MTPQQNDVLQAAIDLMNGGLDMEEALGFVTVVISTYVLKTIPPDAGEIDEQVKAE
jgi:hypothetical protein